MIHDPIGPKAMYDYINVGYNDEFESLETNDNFDEINGFTKKTDNLIGDVNQELHPGCRRLSRLTFFFNLFQIKCMDGIANKAFIDLLNLIKECLPKSM